MKRPEGSAFVLFMVVYALHRFINEMLRTPDTAKVVLGMTLSQNISILMLVAAAGWWGCGSAGPDRAERARRLYRLAFAGFCER